MIGFNLKFKYWIERILFFGFLVLLILLVFFLKIKELNFLGIILHNPLYNYTSTVDWWLYLLIYFNVVFAINSIVFIVITLLIRNYKIKSQKREMLNEQIITDKIMQIIFENNNINIANKTQIDEIISLCKNSHTKKIVLNVLRKIHTQAKDTIRQEVTDILEKLNLNDFIKKNLHSPYFRDKIFAMKVISEFQLGMKNVYDFEHNEFLDDIINLTKKRNYVLRSEAFVSLIKLAIQDDLTFLTDSNLHVSIWDINVVLKFFLDAKNNNINYEQLIQSKEPRVSALGILLAQKHHKNEFKNLILKKIGSVDNLLNFEAYTAYISMTTNQSDYQFLVERFDKENFLIKKSIINAFNKCPFKELASAFLNKVVEEENLILKIDAMKTLMQIDVNKVNDFKHSKNIDIIKARNQVLDFNLN